MKKDNLEILLEDLCTTACLSLRGGRRPTKQSHNALIIKEIATAQKRLAMTESSYAKVSLEDIRGKFDLVLEGHDVLHKEIVDTRHELRGEIDTVNLKIEALNDKIDGVRDSLNDKIDGFRDGLNDKIDSVRDDLGKRIDSVAADLKAHRSDTEVHKKVYKVNEP